MKPSIFELLDKVEAEKPEPEEPKPEPEVVDAHSYLRRVYCDPTQPSATRMRAASIAIAYEAPKLAVSANVNLGFGSQMEAIMEKRGLRHTIDARALPKPSGEAE